jgi:hypothetical protein
MQKYERQPVSAVTDVEHGAAGAATRPRAEARRTRVRPGFRADPMDELGAGFDRLAAEIAHRVDASADPVVPFDDADGNASPRQLARGGDSSHPCADHNDIRHGLNGRESKRAPLVASRRENVILSLALRNEACCHSSVCSMRSFWARMAGS